MPHVSLGLKNAVATSFIDSSRVMEAFDQAERASVPAEEIAAAREALDTELGKRLNAGIAALQQSNVTAQNMEDVANNINLAGRLGYTGEALVSARALFEQKLLGTFGAGDLPFLERSVAVAEAANANVPPKLRHWVGVMPLLRQVAEKPENKTDSLVHFLRALRQSEEVNLPAEVPELLDVQAKAQTCSASSLAKTLAKEEGNTTSPQYVDAILAEIDNARAAGINESALVSAVARAKATALAELQAAITADLTDVGRIKDAFGLADRAGTSAQDLAAKRATLEARLEAQLTNTSWAVGVGPTAAKVRDFAIAINSAFQLDFNETAIKAARSQYKELLQGPFSANDTSLFETLIAMSDHAGTSVTKQMGSQAGALVFVKEVATRPNCEAGKMESFRDLLNAFRRATESDLPSYSQFVAVKVKVRTCAALRLNETLEALEVVKAGRRLQSSGGGMHRLDAFLEALEVAREVGVPEQQLESASATAKADTKDNLDSAVAMSPIDPDDVNEAFYEAHRAGVGAADISAAEAAMLNRTRLRLAAAQTAAQANRSGLAIEELGRAIHLGNRLYFTQEALKPELTAARQLFEKQLVDSVSEKDVPFMEAAIEFAGHAQAHVPVKVTQMTSAAKKVHEVAAKVVKNETKREALPQIIAVITESTAAELPPSEDLAIVEQTAREQATQALLEAISGPESQLINSTLQLATQAGVPEDKLMAARTVLSAL